MVMTEGARVLVVDDDPDIRAIISDNLVPEGYQVRTEADVTAAHDAVHAFQPHVVVLDVMFAGVPDGIELARRLQSEAGVPVLLVSGDVSMRTQLEGFDAGADDFVTKPVVMAELIARIRAVLRRTGHGDGEVWSLGDAVIDTAARTTTVDGEDVELTKIEFDLLVTLIRHRGHVVSKQQLLVEVWGFDAYDPNLVEVHMSALRRKLGPEPSQMIRTMRGVGYVLRPVH